MFAAFYCPDWYTNDNYAGPMSFSYPDEWNGFVGHYRSHNPWYTNFRVIVRKGQLLMVSPEGDAKALTTVGTGEFRVGDLPYSPERLRFDQLVDGKAARANFSGCDYYRFFTP